MPIPNSSGALQDNLRSPQSDASLDGAGLSYLAQTNRSMTVILDSHEDAETIRLSGKVPFASMRLQAGGIGIVRSLRQILWRVGVNRHAAEAQKA